MGMLDTDLSETTEPTAGGEPAEGAPEQNEPAAPPPEPEKPQVVALPSRRQAAAQKREGVEKELQALRESTERTARELREQLASVTNENARMRGQQEAWLQQQSTAARTPAAPPKDPAEIHREARAALDKNDFENYQRLTAEAIRAETIRDVQAMLPKPPPQMDPQVAQALQIEQSIAMRHPAVMAAPQGRMLAQSFDMQLHAQGVPNGPDRWAKAYQMAEAQLASRAPVKPGYSQQGAGALAALPTGGTNGNGQQRAQGPRVELSDLERQWAKLAGMSLEDYATEIGKAHPERILT